MFLEEQNEWSLSSGCVSTSPRTSPPCSILTHPGPALPHYPSLSNPVQCSPSFLTAPCPSLCLPGGQDLGSPSSGHGALAVLNPAAHKCWLLRRASRTGSGGAPLASPHLFFYRLSVGTQDLCVLPSKPSQTE